MTLSAMTTGSRRTALTWLTDVLFAVTFLACEAAVLFVLWLRAAMVAWAASYNGVVEQDWDGTLVALGVVAACAVLLAVVLWRRRWPVAAVTQGLAAAVVALLMAGVLAFEGG
ncbi:hypothetical protein Arub01_23310 [Actinomadura rubrobrunea]|uniref:DUF6234 domain-containing protein n=2 Tax=Actinomadura rubrobrunea TaxID=115335 RepID=A0A9W6PUY4_9ACTN|nr:hypothetical protein Arub01_23310 [Actinomadura rubrobrunea]